MNQEVDSLKELKNEVEKMRDIKGINSFENHKRILYIQKNHFILRVLIVLKTIRKNINSQYSNLTSLDLKYMLKICNFLQSKFSLMVSETFHTLHMFNIFVVKNEFQQKGVQKPFILLIYLDFIKNGA